MDPPDQRLATRGEPSWPRVLATTVQLWLKRRRRRSYLVTAAVLAVAAAVMSSVLAQGTSNGPARGRGAPRRSSPAAVAARQGADWVASQVSPGASVACDPVTCAILQQRGFPAGNLVILRPGALDPRGASVVIATAAVREELGARLTSSPPVLLASFGTGSARTEIQAVAPDGPAAYLTQFRADTAARKAFGAELLGNPAIEASPLARQQLSGGQVDARLIAIIVTMAALHPVRLVSFGDASPGASPGVPLRSAVLYGADGSAATLDSLRAMLLAQHPLYRPASVQTVRLAPGTGALRIVFAAPSPLGLLDATQPLVAITAP